MARQWNEELLKAIRSDFARPTVHARNLHHVSIAMWDAWASFDPRADAVLHEEKMSVSDIETARITAISHAAYRLLRHRFATSPGNDPDDPDNPDNTLNRLRARMLLLGLDPDYTDPVGSTPESLGVRIANSIIQFGLNDGANEANGYSSNSYLPSNPQLDLDFPGNPDMDFPNHWQPLQRDAGFVDQSGHQVGSAQVFLGPEWGRVEPFALNESHRGLLLPDWSDEPLPVYLDPGPPPRLGQAQDSRFKADMVAVLEFSAGLDANDGEWIDISPASLGNNSLGSNDGAGYDINPVTGQAYAPQLVPRGDYLRVIAEYWADGPDSETPPGHWFTLLNKVSDDPLVEHRLGGNGPVLDRLEWDVKTYLALGGAMHDAAITAWSNKGFHDSSRPVSAIRYMAQRGQSSDESAPFYHPDGLPLVPDLIELITAESVQGRHAGLEDHIGEVAVRAWRGHVADPESEAAGVGWIRALDWWPYQQSDFVTPPFAGYVSGHSTFSRAAASILGLATGDEYFPGGLGQVCFAANDYLSFEAGPSEPLCLQWARYADAADQSGMSRIVGGIHPGFDDLPGRVIGLQIGELAWHRARRHFVGDITPLFRDSFSAP